MSGWGEQGQQAQLQSGYSAWFTCRIVSKLKVRPFHSVNSPLVEPVRIRRASGVNCNTAEDAVSKGDKAETCRVIVVLTLTMLTGHLILFVEVWA